MDGQTVMMIYPAAYLPTYRAHYRHSPAGPIGVVLIDHYPFIWSHQGRNEMPKLMLIAFTHVHDSRIIIRAMKPVRSMR